MGLNRRKFLAGALSTSALAPAGCAGTVAKPGDLSRLRSHGAGRLSARLPSSSSTCSAAPDVIGLILGPVAETNLRRALAISDGDVSVLVSSPSSSVVLLVAVPAVVGPPPLRRFRRREAASV